MKFTVADAMELYPLSEGTVLAGRAGLSNEITSISVLEVQESSAMEFIRPGQLEISAMYSVANSVPDQLGSIRMLHECQVSGLILSHVGIIMKQVDPIVIALCNELNFPLILMPAATEYINIISPILDRLVQNKNRQLENVMHMYDVLTHLLLEEREVGQLVSTLSSLINRRVLFYNCEGFCVAISGGPLRADKEAFLSKTMAENIGKLLDQRADLLIEDELSTFLFTPVVSSVKYYGIMVIFDAEHLSDFEKIAIAQTKNSLGIISLHQLNIQDYNRSVRDDFVRDLIQWNFKTEESALNRGLVLGYDLSKIRAALVFDMFRFSHLSEQYSENDLQKLKNGFFNTVQREIHTLSPQSILMNFSDKVLVLFADAKASEKEVIPKIECIAKNLIQVLRRAHGLDISAGIGRYCRKISLIRQSYDDALLALRINGRLLNGPACSKHSDVMIYSLLCERVGAKEATRVAKALLAPLVDYDRDNNTDLLRTFRELLMHDMETNKVAKSLFLHRNTVLQRKRKIRDVLGLDPFIKADRLQYELAFLFEALIIESIEAD